MSTATAQRAQDLMNTTIATLIEDLNDELTGCRACGRQTFGLVQVSLGDVWIGTIPLCDECQSTAVMT